MSLHTDKKCNNKNYGSPWYQLLTGGEIKTLVV